jgi:hypothetical protein
MTKIVTIPADEWERFIPHLSEKIFEKHDFLVRAGDYVLTQVSHP